MVGTDAPLVVAIRSAGGAVADVPAEATAYAGRAASFLLVVVGGGTADLARRWEQVVPTLDGLHLSFETDTSDPAAASVRDDARP